MSFVGFVAVAQLCCPAFESWGPLEGIFSMQLPLILTLKLAETNKNTYLK